MMIQQMIANMVPTWVPNIPTDEKLGDINLQFGATPPHSDFSMIRVWFWVTFATLIETCFGHVRETLGALLGKLLGPLWDDFWNFSHDARGVRT